MPQKRNSFLLECRRKKSIPDSSLDTFLVKHFFVTTFAFHEGNIRCWIILGFNLKLIYKIYLYINIVYNEDGVLEVSRTRQVTKLEIPVRRAKGALGDVTVHWSLYQNESSRVELLWPTSGKVTLSDGQWNESFIVSVDNGKEEAPESVVWVQLDKTTGGAVLASHDQTTAKILIAGNERSGTSWRWIVTVACSGMLLILLVVVLVWWVRRKWKKSER